MRTAIVYLEKNSVDASYPKELDRIYEFSLAKANMPTVMFNCS